VTTINSLEELQENPVNAGLTGTVCIEAYKRLFDEVIRFIAFENYLLQIQLGGLQGNDSMMEAHERLMGKLRPDYGKPSDYFLERAFISLVASFELFIQDVVTTVVVHYPKKVGKVEFKLSEIVDAGSPDELVKRAVEATLNGLIYQKPMEYLKGITELLSLDIDPFVPSWPLFVEAKARRDLGVHNGWRCNDVYLRKVREAGLTPAYKVGERVFPPPDTYLQEVADIIMLLAREVINQVCEKHNDTLSKPRKDASPGLSSPASA
jgi:hypothetical protein